MSKNQGISEKPNMFSTVFRVYGFAKPFWFLFVLSVLTNSIFSFFSAISIALIKPIFQLLFGETDSTINAVTQSSTGFFNSLKDAFYNFITDSVFVPGDSVKTLTYFSILIMSVFISKNIFKYMGSVINAKLQEGIIKSIRDKVFAKMTSLSMNFFTKSRSGTLMSVFASDVVIINSSIINSLTDLIRESVQIIIYMFLLLTISPYLTLIAFSTSIFSLGAVRIGLKFLRRYASRMQAAIADFTSIIQETLAGIRVVKSYNAEVHVNNQFSTQTNKYVKSAVKHQRIIAIIPSVNEISAIVALCFVFFIGGSQVLTGEMKADDLMLFLFSLFAILSPISTVFNNITQFQRGVVSAERVFGVLDTEPTVVSGTDMIPALKEKIEIKNLNFAYNETPVIRNASLVLNKGKKIAFVGSSGSGKSTMLDLLIRFYDPQSGEIVIDGKNIKDFEIHSYRNLFGVVSQENILFNDTVSNNIRFGYEASEQEIIEAAKTANAYNFISKLPEGFNTVIGDRGILLSGGERQRIAIARALVRNPQILVFDEATSALDSESEKVVQSAINDSLKNRTAVLVAHRLATIVNCDEIFVFQNGIICERGTHDELLKIKDGVYKNLYSIQYSK